jgi:3-demethylubiquinone-9 3-methyltransferase
MTETGFQLVTDDQNETDCYWKAIVGNGSQDSACGRCKDKSQLLLDASARGATATRRLCKGCLTSSATRSPTPAGSLPAPHLKLVLATCRHGHIIGMQLVS